MTQPNQTTPNNDLGTALLVIEFEGGAHQPLALVSTLAEAREIVEYNFGSRARNANESACPTTYRLWARDDRGEFQPTTEIEF
ncbi:MAG: hypothetical protein ABI824_16050 [Acidobacteriota bacterium]